MWAWYAAGHPLAPQPLQPLGYYLWICLFWTCHMNGIMGDTVFCDWFLPAMILFSRFTCAVAYIRISCVENKRDYQKRKRGEG